jgi:diguanylate cyclase (GGDEF)-like protein/PAS domain S-box-containing protein
MLEYQRNWIASILSAVAGVRRSALHKGGLRSAIRSIGMLVVLVTCLALPVMIFLFDYLDERRLVSILAHDRAAHLAHQLSADSTFSWAEINRKRHAAEAMDPHNGFRAERVVDDRGTIVLQTEVSPPAPVVLAKSQIFVKGSALGEVEIAASLRPLLLRASLILLTSCILGGMFYLLVCIVPLRALEGIEKLEDRNRQLDAALSNMPLGIAMFSADRKLVFHNDHYGQVYRFPPDLVLIGRTADELNRIRLEAGVFGKVDTEEFCRECHAVFGTSVIRLQKLGDGRVIEVSQRRMPDGGVVITHQDVTEREHLHAALTQREDQLRVALDSMVQGLCMFDAEQKLIVASRRFAEIYGLTCEQVKPGTSFRQIIEHRIAGGLYAGADTEEYIRERLAAAAGTQPDTRTQRLSDGRSICIRFVPLKQGGWVATHEDVTERQQLTDELAARNEQLHHNEFQLVAKNLQLDAALNNMSQGLVMFAATRRLVVANQRYAEMYRLPPELLRPGTPLLDITAFRAKNNLLPLGGVAPLEQMIRDRFERGSASTRLIELGDGREIEVRVQPTDDGGWVATHEDVTEERRIQARIAHMAGHDSLTDLPNRVLLGDKLEAALVHANRGAMLALHFMDLDDFKGINDTLGHSVGDRLLQALAQRLRGSVRETDTVGRLGGDEFAIIQAGIEGPDEAAVLARRLIETLEEPFELDGHQVEVQMSIGIALAPSDGGTADQLLRNADLALYRAKEVGRGSYRFFEPALEERMQKRRAVEADLRKALAAGQFELHYQPFVDVKTLRIKGVEALMRWRHPERGLVSPADYIPLAEETGLIVPIGEWALREACSTVAHWPSDVCVAVNLSPVQFRRPGVINTVVHALAESGLDPRRLELEITESLLLDANESVSETLHQLRALGVKIALDDFGTGYSSLSYLQSFPFDKIKIDRTFIRNLGNKPSASDIVRAIVSMAHALDMSITAEGVETEEQLAHTRQIGCTDFQGYLFSRPRPAEEIEVLLPSENEMVETAA